MFACLGKHSRHHRNRASKSIPGFESRDPSWNAADDQLTSSLPGLNKNFETTIGKTVRLEFILHTTGQGEKSLHLRKYLPLKARYRLEVSVSTINVFCAGESPPKFWSAIILSCWRWDDQTEGAIHPVLYQFSWGRALFSKPLPINRLTLPNCTNINGKKVRMTNAGPYE